MQRWEERERADGAQTHLYMHIQDVHVCSSKVHMHAAEPDSIVSCWPSGAQHVWEREEGKQRQLEKERERPRRQYGQQACLHCCIFPSSITLNRKVTDYEVRAGQSGDSRVHADNPRHASSANMQQHQQQQAAKQHGWTLFHIRLKCFVLK